MSQNHSNASSSNFQLVFNAALDAYEKNTKSTLDKLQSCDSLPAIISEFEELVQQFDRRRKSDQSLTKWLNPTVRVLYAFTKPLGEIAGQVSLT